MVQIGAVTAIAAEIATGRTVFQQVQQPGAAAVVIGAHLLTLATVWQVVYTGGVGVHTTHPIHSKVCFCSQCLQQLRYVISLILSA